MLIQEVQTTSHLTNKWSAFTDYALITPKPIYGLGKSHIWAYGQGTVETLSLKEGMLKPFYLKETLFTPEHPDNLLSIERIDKSGRKIVFGNHMVVLCHQPESSLFDCYYYISCYYLISKYHID